MRDLALRLAIAMVSLLLAAMGFIAALGFFFFAAYLQFADMMAPPLAAVAAAFVALLFSVAVMLVGRRMAFGPGRRRRRTDGSSSPIGGDPAMEFGRRLGEEAYRFVNANRRSTLIASLIAGFAIGASPKLRAYLRSLLGL